MGPCAVLRTTSPSSSRCPPIAFGGVGVATKGPNLVAPYLPLGEKGGSHLLGLRTLIVTPDRRCLHNYFSEGESLRPDRSSE
jgi:hypothetical protein